MCPDLVLRLPREDEEDEFLRAHRATSPDYASFLRYYQERMPFRRYLEVLVEQARGIDVPADHVPTTFLFAFVSERIVGRVSIRHWLNPRLERTGGHIGYVVVPEFRRRGYATQMLTQALRIAHDGLGLRLALVTCDDDNTGSIGTIERCGGVLEDIVEGDDLRKPKRRYWVETAPARDASGLSGANRPRIGRFVADLTQWVAGRPDVAAAGLVGSQARGTACADSDIDLVLVTSDPRMYTTSTSWTDELGQVTRVAVEDYGRATSVRVWYANGLEVEYAFSSEEWAALQPDEGTSRVVEDGLRVLFERRPILSRLLVGLGLPV